MGNKKNLLRLILLAVVAVVCGVLAVGKLGVKDGATFTLSLLLTISILSVGKNDIKKAVYLFIVSMPILVTARKGFYLDFLIFKLNFETLIILGLFIVNYRNIALNFRERFENRENRKFINLILLFVFTSLISSIFSHNILDSLRLTITSVLIPVLLGVIVLANFSKEDMKNLVYALAISINLSCLYGGVQILGIGLSISKIKNSRELLTFGYHNVNIFVNIALMVFPLILNELLYKKNNTKEKLFLIGSIFLQSICIFLTFSRGAWLALGMAVGLILFSKKYKKIFIAITILGLISLPVVLPRILARGGSSTHLLANTSNTARLLSIVTSKEIMKDNLLGVGFGNFNKYYRESAEKAYLTLDYGLRKHMLAPLYTMEHAHNIFLNIGVELGILSLIFILAIFFQRLKTSIKNYSFYRGIFISLIIFIFIGLTTGIELNHKGVISNTYILWMLFSMLSMKSSQKVNEWLC